MTLTISTVRDAEPSDRNYKLADSEGLYLFVTKAGAKSWRFKYRFLGKEKLLTIGRYPEVGLGDARDKRGEAKAMLRAGLDPVTEFERRRLEALALSSATFKAVAEEWLSDKGDRWSPANAFRVRSRLERDIYPEFGNLPAGQVTGKMVLHALRKIEKRGSIETAKRVRGYILGVLKRARAEGLTTTEAVYSVDILGDALKPAKKGAKQPALIQVPELLELQRTLDVSTASALTKLASRLLALTAVRVGVLRTALWDEFEGIDWHRPDTPTPKAMWRIPAARMKLEVDDKANVAFAHEVPLSSQAVEALRAIRVLTGRFSLLFPSLNDSRQPMSDAAISTLYKRVAGARYKGRMVPHGWRSAFSTVMNERAANLERDNDRMIIDLILAHVPAGMSASEWAYNRARYLKPRAALLQVWADLITKGLVAPFDLLTPTDRAKGSRQSLQHRSHTKPRTEGRSAAVPGTHHGIPGGKSSLSIDPSGQERISDEEACPSYGP